jgi:hypothetical protein
MFLFTSGGNNFLKPYLKKYIEKRVKQKVDINSMIIKPDFIDFEILINKQSRFVLNGDFNIFKKKFDLNYKINAISLETPFVYIRSRIALKGKIKGDIKHYSISGEGLAFRAKTKYFAVLSEKKVKKFDLDAKNVRIEEILYLLKKPIFTQGMLDLNAKLDSKDGENFNGTLKSTIYYGVLNDSVLKNNFNLKFDDIINYKGKISSNIKDGIIQSKGEILSNVAKLKFDNSLFNINTKDFYSNFRLKIQDLRLLKPLTKQKLYGRISLDGNIKRENGIFSSEIHSKKFGGKINAYLREKNAKINFTNLRSQEIFKLFGQSSYFSSKIDGEIEVPDISTVLPISDIRVRDGRFYAKPVGDLLGINVPQNNYFSLHVSTMPKDDNLSAKIDFVSSMFNLKSDNINIDTNKSMYDGGYTLSVRNLSDISFLTKRRLRGALVLNGKFSGLRDRYKVNGQTNFLDANSSFVFQDSLAKIHLQNISTSKLLYTAYLPEVFDSNADANLTYNISDKKGAFLINATNGRMANSQLSDLVFAITKFDITKESYDDIGLNGDINNDLINFLFTATSKNSDLNITNGHINLKTKQIDSVFHININQKDLSGKIKGDIEKPKVEINSSQYIKNKIEKVIDKKVPENLKEPIKNLLQLFG